METVPTQKVRIVRNNPSVVHIFMLANFIQPTIVRSCVNWITVPMQHCLCLKGFWETLRAFPIFHTGTILIPPTARTVHHFPHHDVE
jgi:hypothetical protein